MPVVRSAVVVVATSITYSIVRHSILGGNSISRSVAWLLFLVLILLESTRRRQFHA